MKFLYTLLLSMTTVNILTAFARIDQEQLLAQEFPVSGFDDDEEHTFLSENQFQRMLALAPSLYKDCIGCIANSYYFDSNGCWQKISQTNLIYASNPTECVTMYSFKSNRQIYSYDELYNPQSKTGDQSEFFFSLAPQNGTFVRIANSLSSGNLSFSIKCQGLQVSWISAAVASPGIGTSINSATDCSITRQITIAPKQAFFYAVYNAETTSRRNTTFVTSIVGRTSSGSGTTTNSGSTNTDPYAAYQVQMFFQQRIEVQVSQNTNVTVNVGSGNILKYSLVSLALFTITTITN
ncbi:UNKNOWN [Stylonychia lemnae]|uniref:Uncharacterized protein n=1 Tax=Stylonychia lemnae TaxID=5949 RepID=A0A078BCW9_STYLE|nr:UNKNOWN [Stylonychia lemnae]|eukprot:CDW91438.1 UNKNOWN [Stylonychia lemnae]